MRARCRGGTFPLHTKRIQTVSALGQTHAEWCSCIVTSTKNLSLSACRQWPQLAKVLAFWWKAAAWLDEVPKLRVLALKQERKTFRSLLQGFLANAYTRETGKCTCFQNKVLQRSDLEGAIIASFLKGSTYFATLHGSHNCCVCPPSCVAGTAWRACKHKLCC